MRGEVGWGLGVRREYFCGRISGCKYHRIGCPWRGPNHERAQHEQECGHRHKTGAEIMEVLDVLDQKVIEERRLYKTVFELLGYDRITFNGKKIATIYERKY